MMPTTALRSILWRLARVGASAVLLVLVWRAVDGGAALDLLAGMRPGWFAAALAALAAQTVLSAWRWRLTAGRLGQEIGLRAAVEEYFLAQLVNQTLPGGVVGDVGRAVRMRGGAGLGRSGTAVVLERFAGQAALFAVTVCGVLATAIVPGGMVWPAWSVALLLSVMGGGLVLTMASARSRGARAMAPTWLGTAIGHARTALLARDVLPRQVALSLGTVACNLAAFWFSARAVGVVLPAGAVFALVPVILFAMVVPLSVGGWGFREGAAAALFPLAGLAAAQGVAVSVTFGLAVLVSALPGLLPLLRGRSLAMPTTRG